MKKSVKKLLSLTLTLALGATLVGCGSKDNKNSDSNSKEKTIAIGVSPDPHKAIVENAIKPLLEAEGYKVDVIEFADYVLPNTALAEGEIDANYFQHVPFLEATVKEKSYDLSLKLLAKNGIIEIPDEDLITAKDITLNPKNIKVTELDPEQLPRVLKDVDAAVINTNYALGGGLNPLRDALVIEGGDSPYANIIAVRTEDKEKEKIKALTKATTSEEVKKYIEDNYKGAIVPAF